MLKIAFVAFVLEPTNKDSLRKLGLVTRNGDMSDLYWRTDEQMAKFAPFFLKPHGKPRVDDKRVLSGIIFINRNGLR